MIETERLLIKPFERTDFRYFLKLNQDKVIMKYFDEGVKTLDKLRERFNEILAHQKKYGFSYYNFFLKDTNEYIGQGGPYYNFDMSVNVCYGILHPFQRKGYTFEALMAIFNDTFKRFPTINELTIRSAVENIPSINLAKKLGGIFKRSATTTAGLNVVYYSILRDIFCKK